MSADEKELRAELESLQASLASRKSTVHFAHAWIAILVGLGAAAAASAYRVREQWQGQLTLSLSIIAFTYGLTRWVLARRRKREELIRFEALQVVRRALKLDDPSALLPR